MTSDTLNGQHTGYTYDDEDRLTSITLPDGHTDSFSYNGLGMRLSKSDPTGSYWYYTDGVSPASDVLSDNYSTFTPGIGETKGNPSTGYASVFYLADASGNSRGLLNGSQGNTDGYNWDAFGNLVSRFGSNPTGFAWNVSSGYQTDNDDGLTLLGHRYYDKRIGRFISQDPAGDGDNWYQYAGNDPVDETDPTGLFESQGMSSGDIYNEASLEGGPGSEWETKDQDGNILDHFFVSNPDMGIGTPGTGGFMMPASGGVGDSRGQDGLNQLIKDGIDTLNKGGLSKADRSATEKSIKQLRKALKATEKADGDRASRASKEVKEAPGERAARNAANAERRATLQEEQRVAAGEGEVDDVLLEGAELGMEVDEAAIIIGIIVK